MKHVCEVCNTQYGTVEAAEQCELGHKKEKMQLVAKAAAEAKISEAINAFVTKYKAMPNIELTEENQKVLIGDVVGKVEEAFDLILGLLGDDECDDEDCDGCDHCDDCPGCPNEKAAE